MVMVVGVSATMDSCSSCYIRFVVFINFICNLSLMTPEEQQILYENNKMLKKLCDWVDKHDSASYQNNEDFKNFIINLVANSIINPRR